MPGEWEFVLTLTERLRPLRNPADVQQAALHLLGTHLAANRVNYSLIDGDDFIVSCAYIDGVPPLLGRNRIAFFGAAILEGCRRGETVAIDDVRTHEGLTSEERARLASIGTVA